MTDSLQKAFIEAGKLPESEQQTFAAQMLAVLEERKGTTPISQEPFITMTREILTDRLPLRVDEGNAIRVGSSRVNLDLVIQQYENGMTPEDLVRSYDTLVLGDVYVVIGFYLRHRDAVRAYLKRREEEAEGLRKKIVETRPPISREELLARRHKEKVNAPTGE